MELAQLLVTPGSLLAAFSFFRVQSKGFSDEIKGEFKKEIMSVREEVTTIRVEMHDMNGRLGRVKGLLMASVIGRSRTE